MTTALYLEDLIPGQRFASASLELDADAIREFAARFDPQPFHLDDEAARSTLFGGLAASGWHTASLTMRLLVDSDFKPVGGMVGAAIASGLFALGGPVHRLVHHGVAQVAGAVPEDVVEHHVVKLAPVERVVPRPEVALEGRGRGPECRSNRRPTGGRCTRRVCR